MKQPELSIIIPVYNGQDYILRCLDSILRQQGASQYEIIVVNDGSTDDTAKILSAVADAHPNITVITQANAGVSVARNNGIAASHGKYVTFVDCDDMVGLNREAFNQGFDTTKPDQNSGNMSTKKIRTVPPKLTAEHFTDTYFTELLRVANDSGAEVVFGGKITINWKQMYSIRQVYTSQVNYGIDAEEKDMALYYADARENANFALYSRDMLNRHNLRFLANMRLDEDILFCMLAALYARSVATAPNATYFYNRHENTLSYITDCQESNRKYAIAYIQRFSVLLSELDKYPQYATLFNRWIKEYARLGAKSRVDVNRDCVEGAFPPINCCFFCDEPECTGCIVAEGMRENFKCNITKYLGVQSK
jgi:glycosyltransferase involved in cell wall biosynthesis